MAKNTYRILKNGKIEVTFPSGECYINGHITTENNREVARCNGYIFELSELNIVEDCRDNQ